MSSSQSSKVEVLWSPNKDEDFATYSNELKLYTFKVKSGENFTYVSYTDPSCDVIREGVCICVSSSTFVCAESV